MRKKLTIMSVGLFAGIAIFGWLWVRVKRDVAHKVFGGQQYFQALLGSQQISVQRLNQKEGRPRGSTLLDDYEKDPALQVASNDVQTLKFLLQDRSSYQWSTDSAKGCILEYAVVFTCRSPQRNVRVALCLKCDDLGVYDGLDEKSKPVGMADFQPAEREFRALAKRIFPADAEIQNLRLR